MYGDPLEPAVFQDSSVQRNDLQQVIYQSVADPELIVKEEPGVYIGDEVPEDLEDFFDRVLKRYSDHANAIRVLHNDFGISSPNYIVSFEQSHDEQGKKTIKTRAGVSRVHGTYFALEHLEGHEHPTWQLEKIPEQVTAATMGNILNYYEAVLEDRVTHYITDLRLGNLAYGRLLGDYKDEVYLFDIEDYRFSDTFRNGYYNAYQAVVGFRYELLAMQEAYGHGFPELEERYTVLFQALYKKHQDTQELRLRPEYRASTEHE